MIWAILGDIEFELLSHPGAQSERSTADYAEHARLQGKPLLQWVGEGLDELTLEVALHAALVDPEARIRELKKAKAAHQPLPYLLGSGDYRGIYVLTSVDVTTRKTDGSGRLTSAAVNLGLREFTGKYTKPLPNPLALRSAGQFNAQALSAVVAKPQSLAQQALGMAKKAGNLLSTGLDVYASVKNLQSNPLQLLARAPHLISVTGQILEPLKGLQGAAELMADSADLVQLAIYSRGDVGMALETLDSSTVENIVGRVESAGTYIQAAASRMNDAGPRLASLAADVLTRRA
jgi:phage protein U